VRGGGGARRGGIGQRAKEAVARGVVERRRGVGKRPAGDPQEAQERPRQEARRPGPVNPDMRKQEKAFFILPKKLFSEFAERSPSLG